MGFTHIHTYREKLDSEQAFMDRTNTFRYIDIEPATRHAQSVWHPLAPGYPCFQLDLTYNK